MDRVEELLTCPVCLERFKEPKMLPCQHTFCLRPCLQNIVHNNSICCPACRAHHNLSNGIDGLPANLMVVNLLDIPTQQRPLQQCKECQMTSYDVDKCNHCDLSLCGSCIASHTRGLQRDLHRSLTQVRRLVHKLSESDSYLRERTMKLEENGRKVKREISQPIERFISELQSRKKCLFGEVDALVATESGSLQSEREELEIKMAALITHCQVASELCERTVPIEGTHQIQRFQSEILCLTQQGRKHLQSNEISPKKVRQKINLTNRDENAVLSAISNFGTVAAGAQLVCEGDSNPDDEPRLGDRCGAQLSGEWSSATRTHGNVTRVGTDLRRYQNKGEVKKYFGTRGNDAGKMDWPRGISSTAADDIVVADTNNSRIQIFDANGVAKSVFGSCGKSTGQFDYVVDVCVTSRGGIVASDMLNHRIQIFDEYGRFVRTFGREGSGDGELNYPVGVGTDDKGLIYVCDEQNHRVQVFSANGQFVRKFGSEDHHLNQPRYLSVASNGRVVVGDSDNHRVQVFDEYGRHLFQLGMKGTNESQFIYPQGIATDEHGNIIVGDRGNKRVQVFSSDGAFVSCFGSYGSEPGQMRGPEGVCLLSDGRIAVIDCDNHRVQIF